MGRLKHFALIVGVVLFPGLCRTQEIYSDKVSNYVTLLNMYRSSNYSTADIIPRVNQSSPILVTADVELYSVNDFDEVSGQIELSTSITFSWSDEVVLAVTGLANSDVFVYSSNNDSLLVPYDKIWTPKIVLYNSVSSAAAIGGDEFMCRYMLDTGFVTWSPKIIIKSACTPDVTYYPFDRQTCSFSFVTWKFTASEILFQVSKSVWGLTSMEENGEWEVVETSTSAEVVNNQSYLRLSITIERRPLYFAFNIIFPVIALAVLNLMVFWLPSESGERVGFAVTCFLSFVVLLNAIMDILPRSSSPMSFLCYYVVVMMLFSALVTTFTIVQVRIFHKLTGQAVPRFLQIIVRRFKCHSNNDKSSPTGSRVKISPEKEIIEETSEWETPEQSRSTSPTDSHHDDTSDVTWSDVSRFFDILFFLGFLAAQIFFSVTFLLPVGLRA